MIWSATEKASLLTIMSHTEPISALAFSADNKTLASASQSGEIILWDTSTWFDINRLMTAAPVQTLAYSTDGSLLIAGTSDGTLEVWNTTAECAPLSPHKKNTASIVFMVFSADDRIAKQLSSSIRTKSLTRPGGVGGETEEAGDVVVE